MNLILWTIFGFMTGGVMSISLRVTGWEAQKNAIRGAVGAILGGVILTPLVSSETLRIDHLSGAGFVMAVFGAILFVLLLTPPGPAK